MDEEIIELSVEEEEQVNVDVEDNDNAVLDSSDVIVQAVSPRASVTSDSDSATITVTDIDGTTTATVYNGEDGYSPSATVTQSGSTSVITITDKDGTTTAEIKEDKYYEYTQSTPSAQWVIEHNLGKVPCITVIDSAGDEVEGEISYEDLNTAVLTFSGAFSGKAYCN